MPAPRDEPDRHDRPGADDLRARIIAIRRGDDDAFARLHHECAPLMLSVARRSSGLGEDACLDIVQDAMIRVIRAIKPTDSPAALRAWLTRVVQSVAYDHLRAESRRRRREGVAAERSSADRAPETDAAELAERLAWLRGRLSRLDRATRDMVELRARTSLSLARLGATLGVSGGAVDGRVSRALRELREDAKETFDE